MSTISVVVPSRDDARMLRHCLAALAVQTRPPDEVIVVDNGSSDDTATVARAAGARVVSEPRPGVLHATAAGFDAATGDIIGRLDADSIPSPEWAARLEERFDADPTLTGLTGTGRFYGGTALRRLLGRYAYLGGYFWSMRVVMGHVPVFGSNFALRRSAWLAMRERLHIDDPRMHDDLDISFAIRPDMGIEFDRELRVGVSARPFDSWDGLQRRVEWAFHGLAVNLGEESVAQRQWECAAGRRQRRRLQRASRRGGTPPAVTSGIAPASRR